MKLLLPLVVVFALAAAAVVSVRNAIADETVADVNAGLYEAGKARVATGVNIDDAAWKAIEADAKMAVRLAPSNGHYWNALARVYYQPRTIGDTSISPDYASAYQASRVAAVMQPSSGYVWSSLAYASDHLFTQGQLPGGNAAMEQVISRTALLGAREPNPLANTIDLGLANWPQLRAATKQDVMRAINNLAVRNKDDVLAIAYRRGALQTVCTEKVLVSHRVCVELRGSKEANGAASQTGLK
jgi:hypothetical protein